MYSSQPPTRLSPPSSPPPGKQLDPHQLTCAAIYKALVMDPGHLLVRHLPFRSTECDGTIVSGLCHSALMHEALWAAWLAINLHGCVPIMLLPNCADRGEAEALIRLQMHRMNSAILDYIITLNDPAARADSYLYLLHHVSTYAEVNSRTVREGGAPVLVMSGPDMNLLPELHCITNHLGIYQNQQGPCFPYVFIMLDWAGSAVTSEHDRHLGSISPLGLRAGGTLRCPPSCGWSSRPQDAVVCGTAHRCSQCYTSAAVMDFWREGVHAHLAGEVKYAFRTIIITELTHQHLGLNPMAVAALTSPPVLLRIPVDLNMQHMMAGPENKPRRSKHKKRGARSDGHVSSEAHWSDRRPHRAGPGSGLSKSVPFFPIQAPLGSFKPDASYDPAHTRPVQVYTMHEHTDNMVKMKNRRSNPEVTTSRHSTPIHGKAGERQLSDFQKMWLSHSATNRVDRASRQDDVSRVDTRPSQSRMRESSGMKAAPASNMSDAVKARGNPEVPQAHSGEDRYEGTTSARARTADTAGRDKHTRHHRPGSRDSNSSRGSKGSVPGLEVKPIKAPAVVPSDMSPQPRDKRPKDKTAWGQDHALMASLLNLGNRMQGMMKPDKPGQSPRSSPRASPRQSPRRSPRRSPLRTPNHSPDDHQAAARHDSGRARRRLQDQLMRKNAAPHVEIPPGSEGAARRLNNTTSSSRSGSGLRTELSMMAFTPDQSHLVPYSGSEDEDFSFAVVPPMVSVRSWGGEITPSKSEPEFERLSSPDSTYSHRKVPPSPPAGENAGYGPRHDIQRGLTSAHQHDSSPSTNTASQSPFTNVHANSVFQHELMKELPTGEEEEEEEEVVTLPAYTWSSAADGEVFEITPNLMADPGHEVQTVQQGRGSPNLEVHVVPTIKQSTRKQAVSESTSANSSGSLPSILSSGNSSTAMDGTRRRPSHRHPHHNRPNLPREYREPSHETPPVCEPVDEDSVSSMQSMSYMSFPAGLDARHVPQHNTPTSQHNTKTSQHNTNTPTSQHNTNTLQHHSPTSQHNTSPSHSSRSQGADATSARQVETSATGPIPRLSAARPPTPNGHPEALAAYCLDDASPPSTPSGHHLASQPFIKPKISCSPSHSLRSLSSVNSEDSTTYPPTPAQTSSGKELRSPGPVVMSFRELREAATNTNTIIAAKQDENGSSKLDPGWNNRHIKREPTYRYPPSTLHTHRPSSPESDSISSASSADMDRMTHRGSRVPKPPVGNSSLFYLIPPSGVRELPEADSNPYTDSPTIAQGNTRLDKGVVSPTYNGPNSYTVNPTLTPRRLKMFARATKGNAMCSSAGSVRKPSAPSVGVASSTASGGGSPVWRALTKAVRWKSKPTDASDSSPAGSPTGTANRSDNPYYVPLPSGANSTPLPDTESQLPKTPRHGLRLKQSWNKWVETAKGKVQGL